MPIIFLSLLLFSFPFQVEPSDDEVKVKLTTASKKGGYHSVGRRMEKIMEGGVSGLLVEVVNSEGSIQNVGMIIDGEVELAIVQNNVASRLGMSGPDSTSLTAIMTLYPEPVFVLTNLDNITHFDLLLKVPGLVFSLGAEGSGTSSMAKEILDASGMKDEERKIYVGRDEQLEFLGSVFSRAVFVNTISDDLMSAITAKEIYVVSLSNALVKRVTEKNDDYRPFERDIGDEEISTVAVSALLVAAKNQPSLLMREITAALDQRWDYLRRSFPTHSQKSAGGSVVVGKGSIPWNEASESYYMETGRIKKPRPLILIFLTVLPVFGFISLLTINFVVWIFRKFKIGYLLNKFSVNRLVRSFNALFVRFKYFWLLITIATTYLAVLLLIELSESIWATDSLSLNAFTSRDFSDNLLWLFTFATTGAADGVFPDSPLGKLLVTFIPMLGYIVLLGVASLVTSDHIKNRIIMSRGLAETTFRDHVIICGWNSHVPFLAKSMYHSNLSQPRNIVLLAEAPDEHPLSKHDLDPGKVHYIQGSATNRKDLNRANLAEADVALIVADSKARDKDASTILKVLTIEKHCLELEEAAKNRKKGSKILSRAGRKNIYTIAEIISDENTYAAQDAMVDEIISSEKIKTKLFINSIVNRGAAEFIDEILSFDDNNDICSIPVEEKSVLRGYTFDDLLPALRKTKFLLVAINIDVSNMVDNYGKEIEKDVLDHFGLGRKLITNPIEPSECAYETRVGDILLVLAKNAKTVDLVARSNSSDLLPKKFP